MKRIFVVLICLVLVTVSIPFSATGESVEAETSIEFKEHILEASFNHDAPEDYESTYYGIGFVPKVIDSIEARDKTLEYCDDFVAEGSIYAFLSKPDEDFFKEKAILLISAMAPSLGYDYSISDVTVSYSYVTIYVEYTEPRGCAADAVQENIIMAEINKADIAGRKDYFADVTNVTETPSVEFEGYVFEGYIPEETLREYEATLSQYAYRTINPYYGRHIDPFVITNAQELADVRADVVSEEFEAFAEGLTEDFFDSKAIIAVYSKAAYSPAIYEFTALEADLGYLYLTYTVDESGAYGAGERVEQHNILVAVFDKSVLEDGASSYSASSWGERIDVLGDVRETGSLDPLDYILLKRAYFGTYKLDEGAKERGDINKNGEIDMMDYVLLKRAWFGTYKLKGDIKGIAY